jgi:hypothetical protein
MGCVDKVNGMDEFGGGAAGQEESGGDDEGECGTRNAERGMKGKWEVGSGKSEV